MSHHKTGNGSPVNHGIRSWATNGCSSGKRAWMGRADAKSAANQAARNGLDKLRPYQCPECGLWHIGHLPQAVLRGEVGRSDYYAEGGAS